MTWSVINLLFPLPFHGLRRTILVLFGARLHATAKVYPSAMVWYPRNLVMDEFTCLGPDVNCYCMAPITIEAYALVSQGAHLCAGAHDIDDPNLQLVVRPITLARNSWVAAEAFMGPGSELGEGAVLGARAVLFGRLEPWTVAIGNPARVIRHRRKPDTQWAPP
jgi:putative colanic acid biosynthesis acetyltransferase WcaF